MVVRHVPAKDRAAARLATSCKTVRQHYQVRDREPVLETDQEQASDRERVNDLGIDREQASGRERVNDQGIDRALVTDRSIDQEHVLRDIVHQVRVLLATDHLDTDPHVLGTCLIMVAVIGADDMVGTITAKAGAGDGPRRAP